MVYKLDCYLLAVLCCDIDNVKPTLCALFLLLALAPGFLMISEKTSESKAFNFDDSLTPYETNHGPLHRSHRDTQKCQSVKYGNVTHTKHRANADATTQLVETHYLLKEVSFYSSWNKKLLYINHQVVNNPLTTWSVLEPGHPGTCQNGTSERATVQFSSEQKQCLVATNAGFFNTHTGQCLGNIVSDGFLVQDSGGIQNVHLGITRDGYIYTGYLSELDLLAQDFTQLVGGVIWLVRDGQSYVDESKAIECPDTEETGTVERFITVEAARTAVGHDDKGRLHMVQVNGKTDVSGLDLYKFADLLLELGLVNAINLDGGGSVTTVINETLASYPSDQCTNSSYNCPRKVTTILCVHQPSCSPPDCSGHGLCEMGVCVCQGYWVGHACDRLQCPGDCSKHGDCATGGCQCHPGWKGFNCSLSCDKGWHGANCSQPCACATEASCDPITGACQCGPGYTGKYCQSVCPPGYFGHGCKELCSCKESCSCDHVSGSCNYTIQESLLAASNCLARQEIERRNLTPNRDDQYTLCVTSLAVVVAVATTSLFVNGLLIFLHVRLRHNQHQVIKRRIRVAIKHAMQRMQSFKENSESDNEEEDDVVAVDRKKDGAAVIKEEDENVTGSGDEEDDLFIAPKRVSERVKK